jgi:hypothetical protein
MERILCRILVWAGYSDRTAFVKQNVIQVGIDECYRELSTCLNRFVVRPLFHYSFYEASCFSFPWVEKNTLLRWHYL